MKGLLVPFNLMKREFSHRTHSIKTDHGALPGLRPAATASPDGIIINKWTDCYETGPDQDSDPFISAFNPGVTQFFGSVEILHTPSTREI